MLVFIASSLLINNVTKNVDIKRWSKFLDPFHFTFKQMLQTFFCNLHSSVPLCVTQWHEDKKIKNKKFKWIYSKAAFIHAALPISQFKKE